MNIDAPRPVETACVFFRDGFVESVARDAAADPLESSANIAPLTWISRLHTDDTRSIVTSVQTLARRCSANLMPSSLEEELLLLAQNLLLLYGETGQRLRGIRAEKASTQEELFRRVERGREYMHSQADGPLSLEAVARAACLSRFHFHRAFAQVWGKTPHEYLTGIRLKRARGLLESGVPVEAVCIATGFLSVSSFSRLFRSVHGITPGQVRANRKIGHSNPVSAAV
jgi:transcriptional regulator GlxA family with amidase domain